MKPGAIAWPPTSTTASAAPDNLPISTILPSLTATSPWNDAIPEPSTTRPFLIKTSYAILCSSCSRSVVVAVNYSTWRRPVVGDCATPRLCAPHESPHRSVVQDGAYRPIDLIEPLPCVSSLCRDRAISAHTEQEN